MRVLITGGAGFIGSRLAERLGRDGHSVVILDNLLQQVHGGRPSARFPEAECIWADVRDPEAVAKAVDGVDIIHHLAAETGVGQSQYEVGRYVSTNTHGTAVVLEAAAAAGVGHVVIASSRAVYGEGEYHCLACQNTFVPQGRHPRDLDAGIWDPCCPVCGEPSAPLPMAEDAPCAPTSVYGMTKMQQEELARCVGRHHDLPVTVLRFFNVYGPGQSMCNPYVGVLGTFFRRAQSGRPIELYEDGLMLRDFVFVQDVVEVLHLCTGNERVFGQTLNVGTGQAITLRQLALEVFHSLSLEPDIAVSGRYRVGDVRHTVADIARLQATLGFRPQTPFARGMRQYLNWASENRSDTPDSLAEEQLATWNLLRQGAR